MRVFHTGWIILTVIAAPLLAKEEKQDRFSEELLIVDNNWRNEVSEIDKEIGKLENQRNLYLAKATRLQNQGDRLQFENNNLIDARRAWQQAQIMREIATRIQEEINELQEKRQKIVETYEGVPKSKASK